MQGVWSVAGLHECMHACMHACTHTRMHTCMHACMHACLLFSRCSLHVPSVFPHLSFKKKTPREFWDTPPVTLHHMFSYIHMWGRLLLVVSLFAESREMVEGGKIKTNCPCGPLGPCGPGPYGPGPHGPGPYGPRPYGPPWALMGRAHMGPVLKKAQTSSWTFSKQPAFA